MQYLAGGFILCTVSMSIGTILGFSAILLPQLEEENLISSKSHQASWIGRKFNLLNNKYFNILNKRNLINVSIPKGWKYIVNNTIKHFQIPSSALDYVLLFYIQQQSCNNFNILMVFLQLKNF